MNQPINLTIAPVRKSIRVKANQARAFEVFTAGLDRWWPRKASVGSAPMKAVKIEPKVGGRWVELGEDGSEAVVGRILAWDPPRAFAVSWDLTSKWKPDMSGAPTSEVEVKFIAEADGTTSVELEHRLFERLGAEAGEKCRSDVERGWPGMLELFKGEVEGTGAGSAAAAGCSAS